MMNVSVSLSIVTMFIRYESYVAANLRKSKPRLDCCVVFARLQCMCDSLMCSQVGRISTIIGDNAIP